MCIHSSELVALLKTKATWFSTLATFGLPRCIRTLHRCHARLHARLMDQISKCNVVLAHVHVLAVAVTFVRSRRSSRVRRPSCSQVWLAWGGRPCAQNDLEPNLRLGA